MSDAKVLAIVVPCYNEESVLPISLEKFRELLHHLVVDGKIAAQSYIFLVDDGSRDATWSLIERFAAENDNVRGLKLSRNRGHQNAVLAGMFHADGDIVVTIDADLQDDLDAIKKMIDAHIHEGADVVYGVRSVRDTDSAFKRLTAEGFYKVLGVLGVEVVFNHADFRLLSKRAIEAFQEFDEVNLFLRGLVPMLGFKSAVVEYSRAERAAGESKYPLKKMLSLAWEGVTSLSIKPLRMITTLGVLIAGTAFAGVVASIVVWAAGEPVSGWTSLMVTILFLGGVQLLAMGIIGEYLGKVYLETKRRPRYIVERTTPRSKRNEAVATLSASR